MLNADYTPLSYYPLSLWPWQTAVKALFLERVDIVATYESSGEGAAMAKFIAIVGHQGPVPAGFAEQPGPDPAMFGLPTEDDGSRDDVLLAQNLVTCTHYEHDFEALRGVSTRIVVAVGAESGDTLAARTARAVADRLGAEPVTFPGDHGGFSGGEYGHRGAPDGFAAALRRVLDGA